MGRDVPFDFDDKCDKCGKPAEYIYYKWFNAH